MATGGRNELSRARDDDDARATREIELATLARDDDDDGDGGGDAPARDRREADAGRAWLGTTAACAFAVATCYADRSNISTAIVAMKDGFGWDKFEEGLVLSAFFYGYGATQIVGGRWADRAGGKTTLGWGVAAWSAATALTPAAARAGIAPLIAMRVILGMGEGLAFPACHALIAREVPREKRSTAVAAVTAASYAGAAFAFAVTPGLVSEFGWPSAFYSFGAIALLWAPFWFALPDHREPRGVDDEIEDAETRRFIAESSATATKPPASFAIWTELIRRKEVRAICVAQFTQSWGMYGLLSWLPTYFNEAQGVDLADLPAFTFAPYILQGVLGFGVGIIADDLIHNKNVRVKTVRRAAQCAGTLGPALCLLVAASPLAEGNATLAAVAVDLGLALSALTLAGVSVSHLDIAPRHAGMVFATGNTAATLAGALAVPVSGAILDASDSWSLVFAVIAFVYVSGAIYWYVNLGDRELTLDADARDALYP
ncbi:MFS family transporter: phosphate/sugar [Ostreococcus lucimarinus CCE9901]|jgi:ACS family sodium-dependent inorganic phosphate cotransporter|uniref:MFS family transporter: phosphate/sugar n=1 Tax=Ostreococcus lucimarinus (strain CCE9901) TaxID=436017 RepID=A4S3W0_OSTLU|nr:MFS family transporter: phosphate/sugar [Ostreococcus lucimarinus CCE9901]ABO98456.1 MFS family transporter: phosphate/sugar [Ostreococcus lucimarinus CCE9901]|eukprot:XP_001420163.1 MFS family transporter: phosphate/sugar [Ostreococcus lucimarinus CCE9901]